MGNKLCLFQTIIHQNKHKGGQLENTVEKNNLCEIMFDVRCLYSVYILMCKRARRVRYYMEYKYYNRQPVHIYKRGPNVIQAVM